MASVSEASQAPSPGDPAADAPRTDAQQAEAERVGDVDVAGNPIPSDAQQKQYEEDVAARAADPDLVVGREANAEFGGESFEYGKPVRAESE